MTTQIVGILNITPDSFSDGGKFNSLDAALKQTQKLINDGADVIDIGAESTRPTATKISAAEEWSRLEKILPEIIALIKKSAPQIKTSIDSYHFETLVKSFETGVDIMNDVSGLSDDRIVDFIARNHIETILMHHEKIPAVPDSIINRNINLIPAMLRWFEQKISYLEQKGVQKSQLILDPGIGFGKDAMQSIRILKNIEQFRKFKMPIYVGHSKKSFLEEVKVAGDRAEKTLVISKYLMLRNTDFIRVHDVSEHVKLRHEIKKVNQADLQ